MANMRKMGRLSRVKKKKIPQQKTTFIKQQNPVIPTAFEVNIVPMFPCKMEKWKLHSTPLYQWQQQWRFQPQCLGAASPWPGSIVTSVRVTTDTAHTHTHRAWTWRTALDTRLQSRKLLRSQWKTLLQREAWLWIGFLKTETALAD